MPDSLLIEKMFLFLTLKIIRRPVEFRLKVKAKELAVVLRVTLQIVILDWGKGKKLEKMIKQKVNLKIETRILLVEVTQTRK